MTSFAERLIDMIPMMMLPGRKASPTSSGLYSSTSWR
jgi:hypothetical protein